MKAIAEATPTTRTESRMRNPTLRAYAALALGALCIGFSAIFTKWAGVPGPVSGFYRVVIATGVLAVPFALQTTRRRARSRSGPGLDGEQVASTSFSFTLPLLWG